MKSAVTDRNQQGLRPLVVAGILGVSLETLRYWRNQLEPIPHLNYYSTRDLLTFRTIKWLLNKQVLTVRTLRKCQLSLLFEWWRSAQLPLAATSCLVIETDRWGWRVINTTVTDGQAAWSVLSLPLDPVIQEHYKSLDAYASINVDVIAAPYRIQFSVM